MLVNTLAGKIKAIERFFQNVYLSVLGFAKVLILSKFNVSLPLAKHRDCILLGNGPSLKESFEKNDAVLFNKIPLLCVNNFAHSEQFYQYKPAHYVLLDPAFFIYKQREDVVATMNILKGKVDWEINLFVPYLYKKDSDMEFLIKKNSFVKVYFFNYTVLKGFNLLKFNIFKKNLAMPQFYNVLGAAIFLTINMGYKKIWIMGADHSWFKNIYVNDDNSLSLEDKHFYDEGKINRRYMKNPVSGKSPKIGEFFQAIHRVFNSYYILEKYSNYRGSKIYNASEYSYIDAFERKKIEI